MPKAPKTHQARMPSQKKKNGDSIMIPRIPTKDTKDKP
jgi:hypothetical protein